VDPYSADPYNATAAPAPATEEGEPLGIVLTATQPTLLVVNAMPGTWRQNAKTLTLREPIFLGRNARLSPKQHKPQPVLFMCLPDFEMVSDPDVTHAGAFGSDYQVFEPRELAMMYDAARSSYDPLAGQMPWVVVWKFPTDLSRLPTFAPIFHTPLAVGCYNFNDDAWWVPPPVSGSDQDCAISYSPCVTVL
jgi:hypothetical protein